MEDLGQRSEFSGEDVVWFYSLCEDNGIEVWIDGGWAVDALLQRQTRPHGDLDIALSVEDEPKLRALLRTESFDKLPDGTPWNYVMGDAGGRKIDFHAFTWNEQKQGILGPIENGHVYPASALAGQRGRVLGREVRCIAAEDLVTFHTGYQLRETDHHDVRLLCTHFGIELPAEYKTDAGL